jgi:hypothetical protein
MTRLPHCVKPRVTRRGWVVIAAAWLITVMGVNYILANVIVSCDMRPQHKQEPCTIYQMP